MTNPEASLEFPEDFDLERLSNQALYSELIDVRQRTNRLAEESASDIDFINIETDPKTGEILAEKVRLINRMSSYGEWPCPTVYIDDVGGEPTVDELTYKMLSFEFDFFPSGIRIDIYGIDEQTKYPLKKELRLEITDGEAVSLIEIDPITSEETAAKKQQSARILNSLIIMQSSRYETIAPFSLRDSYFTNTILKPVVSEKLIQCDITQERDRVRTEPTRFLNPSEDEFCHDFVYHGSSNTYFVISWDGDSRFRASKNPDPGSMDTKMSTRVEGLCFILTETSPVARVYEGDEKHHSYLVLNGDIIEIPNHTGISKEPNVFELARMIAESTPIGIENGQEIVEAIFK